MKVAVCGGTGSFGSAFVKKYHQLFDITVISRDENKQHEMRLKYPDVKYVIGDIRDRERMFEVLQGFDYVFQAAALKQVPACEFFPLEAVKTNVIGTANVIDAAKGAKIVCLSTDKAVYPINAMGTSKAMMEKVAISKGAIVTRYGNVMKSRGSIIPIWQENARKGEPLNITNPDMTRFLLSLDDSIDLVMFAMENGNAGDIFVKKAPACTILTLAKAISDDIRYIGTRHGEKLHESLISSEEMARAVDMLGYYRITKDSRDLNYNQYFTDGKERPLVSAYSSDNTEQLTVEQVKELLNEIR